MKNKDQILLEQEYSKILENKYENDVFQKVDWKARNDDRNAGLEEEDDAPRFKERREGDEFTDNRGIKRIMVRNQQGKLIPVEKVFTSKKNGKTWERFKMSDGKIGVKPFVAKPKPEKISEPNPF
jgi:hypothetical protein